MSKPFLFFSKQLIDIGLLILPLSAAFTIIGIEGGNRALGNPSMSPQGHMYFMLLVWSTIRIWHAFRSRIDKELGQQKRFPPAPLQDESAG